jgi:hypothetical protein
MSERHQCARCGEEMIPGQPCRKCLLRLALEETVANAGDNESLTPGVLPGLKGRIGKYQLLGVLGEGGMGVVFKAEQEHPRRVIALKVIKAGRSSVTVEAFRAGIAGSRSSAASRNRADLRSRDRRT